jgi:acetyl-CoA carboxylase carboxyl transferase subunit beta
MGEKESLWVKCDDCGEMIYRKQWESLYKVCPKCGYHFRIGARERIEYLLDKGSFKERDKDLRPSDPLSFKDSIPYPERLKKASSTTGLTEAVITGEGKIEGEKVGIGVMDFGFMGGSMGSVVGEKITRLIEWAEKKGLPLIIVSSSGGARMQEGILSLMQMVKTSSALARFSKLYISILTHPTTGGVTASFASLGDIIIAEPKSLIGFAGPRVIEKTIKQTLPEGFQQAEFLLEHGFVDMVVPRKRMKEVVAKLLKFFK